MSSTKHPLEMLHEIKLQRSIGTLWAYNSVTKTFEPSHILNIENEQRFIAEIKKWEAENILATIKITELLEKYPIYEKNPAYDAAIIETLQ